MTELAGFFSKRFRRHFASILLGAGLKYLLQHVLGEALSVLPQLGPCDILERSLPAPKAFFNLRVPLGQLSSDTIFRDSVVFHTSAQMVLQSSSRILSCQANCAGCGCRPFRR